MNVQHSSIRPDTLEELKALIESKDQTLIGLIQGRNNDELRAIVRDPGRGTISRHLYRVHAFVEGVFDPYLSDRTFTSQTVAALAAVEDCFACYDAWED